jgi:hypothetical protein
MTNAAPEDRNGLKVSESVLRLILRRAVGSTHPVHPHTSLNAAQTDGYRVLVS